MTEDEIDLVESAFIGKCSVATVLRAAEAQEITRFKRTHSTFLREEVEEWARRRAARQRKAPASQPQVAQVR